MEKMGKEYLRSLRERHNMMHSAKEMMTEVRDVLKRKTKESGASG